MRIDLVLQQWIDILAALLLGLRETWRSRHALIVARGDNGFVVRHDGSDDGAMVATIERGALAAPEFIRLARRRFITFELPTEEVAVQRISVPTRAREFIAGIVRNQIERLSPWQSDQVTYGFSAEISEQDAETLNVRVLMISNAILGAAREELAKAGLDVDRIIVCGQETEPNPPVVIWSRLGSVLQGGNERTRRIIASSMIAVFVLSAGLAVWAQMSAASIRSDSDDVTTQSAALQRQLQEGRGGPSGALHDPAERAWNLKETSPSSVEVLESLSRSIPDDAYITELSLQNATVRIVGMTIDAPSLIAPLERSGQFADVHFFAPTTRGPDGSSFVFHIEGRVISSPP